jgi:diadenosine tetraphosphate (Ap4A) HIT family hydrolase
MFVLSPDLTRSATAFFDLPLSTVLLKEDARWPWVLLVPRVAGASEMTDLADADAARLMTEIRAAARAVAAEAGVTRTNVGALGNIAPQLHVHVIGRWPGDAAWPGPVWGVEGKAAYAEPARAALIARLTSRLDPRRGP